MYLGELELSDLCSFESGSTRVQFCKKSHPTTSFEVVKFQCNLQVSVAILFLEKFIFQLAQGNGCTTWVKGESWCMLQQGSFTFGVLEHMLQKID